jgi:hypothetical protein
MLGNEVAGSHRDKPDVAEFWAAGIGMIFAQYEFGTHNGYPVPQQLFKVIGDKGFQFAGYDKIEGLYYNLHPGFISLWALHDLVRLQ